MTVAVPVVALLGTCLTEALEEFLLIAVLIKEQLDEFTLMCLLVLFLVLLNDVRMLPKHPSKSNVVLVVGWGFGYEAANHPDSRVCHTAFHSESPAGISTF